MNALVTNDATLKAESKVEAPARPGRKRAVLFGVLGAAAVGAAVWIITHRGLGSTADAQIDGEVLSLAARTSCFVVKVSFEDNERVEAGRVLAELDPEPFKARLAPGEANVEAAG